MQTRLIINADDFGYSHAVNEAVIKAHTTGVLTAASLMVTGIASDEAVRKAKDHPTLAVGLHLTLTMGRSILPPEEIPDLVDSRSHFTPSPVSAGFHYFFSSRARKQLKAEIFAQFQAFAKTGLPFSHVDGHQHLHVHPAVFPVVLDLCREYGVPGIRIPRESFLLNLRIDRSRLLDKLIVSMGHGLMSKIARRYLCVGEVAICDTVIGSGMSGNMTEEYVSGILQHSDAKSIELFFHPSDPDQDDYVEDRLGPNGGDLRTLLSPELRSFLSVHRYSLRNYGNLSSDFTEELRAGF